MHFVPPAPMPVPVSEEKHHTVINGVIQHLSVSQINSFNPNEDGGCNARWHFVKVQGKKEPERDFNKTGTAVHAQLKHYLQSGEDVLGRIARAGLNLLPPRGEGLRFEWGLHDKPQPVDDKGKALNYFPPQESLVKVAGISLIGFIDVIDPRPVHVLENGSLIQEPGVVEVLDHKTTSNWKWAKSREKLPETSQMNGYGVFASVKFPWATHVRQSHLVYLTSAEEPARKASIVVPVTEIQHRWRSVVEPLVEKMKWVAKQPEEKVEGNLGACEAYGGCPHKLYCGTFKNRKRGKKLRMGLLRNKPVAAAPAVNGAAVAAAAAAVNNTPWIPAPPGLASGPIMLQAPVPPPPAAAPAPRLTFIDVISVGNAVGGQTYITADGKAVNFISEAGAGWRVFSPVGGGAPIMLDNTQQITVFNAPAATAAAPVAVAVAPVVVRDAGAPPPPAPLAVQIPAAPTLGAISVAPAAPVAAVAEKRGRGRPRKVAGAPATAQVVQAAQPEAAVGGTDVEIYINAIPPGPFTNLNEYVTEACTDLQEEYNVSDIRCAPIDSPIGYRKWEGALAAAVKAEPPAAGTYVAFTKGNQFVEIVAETLASMYPQSTVRGV